MTAIRIFRSARPFLIALVIVTAVHYFDNPVLTVIFHLTLAAAFLLGIVVAVYMYRGALPAPSLKDTATFLGTVCLGGFAWSVVDILEVLS